ncbi:HEAT repeat domain-containing protein [Microbacterium sp. H1-D42]|uniref:HEAT repeat domain-containing protein n=1 Tax=Microbacterium sp. H1-D42 TaxID=2925844 RepID=UPI001F53AA83|nr:HEAT repeat domain-containing protein [Microbacterium sp. H1-D42]UNK69849.1 HEAT repeat domain-containing protein [Microbacterium sp. H1-D42]
MPQNPHATSSDGSLPDSIPLAQRIESAVELDGESEVVTRALSLMAGNNEGDSFLILVGGEHAQGILDGAPPLYWPELWGTRTLLYAWDESAAPAVIRALGNPAWRVREMAARVIAARDLPAVAELTALITDDTPRVRIAAARALGAVGTMDDLDSIRTLLKDPLVEVRRGAQQARDALRARFPKSPSTESQ